MFSNTWWIVGFLAYVIDGEIYFRYDVSRCKGTGASFERLVTLAIFFFALYSGNDRWYKGRRYDFPSWRFLSGIYHWSTCDCRRIYYIYQWYKFWTDRRCAQTHEISLYCYAQLLQFLWMGHRNQWPSSFWREDGKRWYRSICQYSFIRRFVRSGKYVWSWSGCRLFTSDTQ